jgi:protein-disulfide isomerase
MTIGSQGSRPSKNQRREEARQTAREHRAEAQKSERRRRFLVQGGVVAGIIVIVAVIGLVIWSAVPSPGPRPANMASDGILLQAKLDANGVPTGEIEAVLSKALPDGAEPVTTTQDPNLLNIVVYVDYQCPVCRSFNTADAPIIQDRVASGAATIEIHPISMLDRMSMGTRFSSRAANAAACVATYDPNKFLSFDDAMFNNQPDENATGLDNAALKEIVKSVGADRQAEIGTCIDNETFKSWVASSWNRVKDAPALPNTTDVVFGGTPTVIVNGTQFNFNTDPETGAFYPAQFSDFLLKIQSLAAGSTSTPTPKP